MSFLGRKQTDDNQQSTSAFAPNPDNGLPIPDEGSEPAQNAGVITNIKNSYNVFYKIKLEPSMPERATIAILIVGVIIGMIFAYAIFPTEFTGAGPRRMSDDAIEQWVRMVAVGYSDEIAYTEDTALAVLNQLPNPQQVAERLASDPSVPDFEQVAIEELQAIDGFEELTGSIAPRDPGLFGSLIQWVIPIMLVIIFAPVITLAWRMLIYPNMGERLLERIKQSDPLDEDIQPIPAEPIQQDDTIAQPTITQSQRSVRPATVPSAQDSKPILTTISDYTRGRHYDDSFAIELGPEYSNQFLGECGAGIATTINNELQAVEFWGFDMATQKTLTKIFAAPDAVNDPALQAQVSNRIKNPATDIVPATIGNVLTLETDAIRIQGEVASVTYNNAGGTPQSAIENIQIKITAWQKHTSPVAGASALSTTFNAPPVAPPQPPETTYNNIQFNPPPSQPAYSAPEDFADSSFNPPPSQPAYNAPEDYADSSFNPPPSQPAYNAPEDFADSSSFNPPQPPTQPNDVFSPLEPPPLNFTSDDDDDDPFGGTGDFTPLR
jgi:hypothetical protein